MGVMGYEYWQGNLNRFRGASREFGKGHFRMEKILTSMAWLGIPVSTTQSVSGAIMVVGPTTRLSAVRWGFGKRIVYAWIITILASAVVAGLILYIIIIFWYSGK